MVGWLLVAALGCSGDKETAVPLGTENPDCEPSTWYADVDADGWGAADDRVSACEAPTGYVDAWGDCDDTDSTVHPDGTETCNGVDDDCDDTIDDGVLLPWYGDADGDGYGAPGVATYACEPPEGMVGDGTDCNDTNAAVHPGADEVVQDGIDDDCSGRDSIWCFVDDDGDGFGTHETVAAHDGTCDTADGEAITPAPKDCDDTDPTVYPDAPDPVEDGIDQDCDGADAIYCYGDGDGDGFGAGEPVGSATDGSCDASGEVGNDDDCDDTSPMVSPAGMELCNGVDDDCDGDFDEDAQDAPTWWLDTDGDGYGAIPLAACDQPKGYSASGGDCNDGDPSIHPGAVDLCDGIDNNCDGQPDEDRPLWPDADGDGYGRDDGVVMDCAEIKGYVDSPGDCDDDDPSIHPSSPEECDGVDNDCDGAIDADDADVVDAIANYPDADGDGAGSDETVEFACGALVGYLPTAGDCDDHDAAVGPHAVELCNEVDDDCDGDTDEDDADDAAVWTLDGDGDGHGDPAGSTVVACTAPSGFAGPADDCDDLDPAVYPGAPEACDGRDNNCDGVPGGSDDDGDGFAGCEGDCDDTTSDSYPGAPEICDGLDNDCNGVVDDDGAGGLPWTYHPDDDGDGYGNPWESQTFCGAAPSGWVLDDGDCRDTDATVNPGAPEVCDDGIDNDCSDGDLSCLVTWSGIRTVVPEDELVGWTPCYVGDFADTVPLTTVFSACTGTELMVACRVKGSTDLRVAAHAPVDEVLTDTGTGNVLHQANGVGWYYSSSYSMGYAHVGDGVSRNSCDTQTGAFPDERLCFHTSGNQLTGGYRCGATVGLNASHTWERVLYTATP